MLGKKIDEIEVAMDLLKGNGLNRASFARVILDKDSIIPKDKDATRELFDKTLSLIKIEHEDKIYKDGHDHFIKEVDVEVLQNQLSELIAQNLDLREKIANMSGGTLKVVERRQCLYRKGEAKRFFISEVEGKLKDGWKEHPKD